MFDFLSGHTQQKGFGQEFLRYGLPQDIFSKRQKKGGRGTQRPSLWAKELMGSQSHDYIFSAAKS